MSKATRDDMFNQLWALTASEAKELIVQGRFTLEHYTKSLLERIKARDSGTKAWVYLNSDLALKQAREMDCIPLGLRGPLHGVVLGVKDVILTKDMPTQYNSKLFECATPITMDAASIQTLRAAGALILGKTSTTEFAATRQGNWHQNLTRNAHSPERTPGGSSSGSGAAVGDLHIPIAIGTQTGGSTIRPGSYNGVYAFKPTWGSISREGLAQISTSLDTIGFFARSVADIQLLLQPFRFDHDESRLSASTEFRLEGARIGFCKSPSWPNAGQGTIKSFMRAREILEHKCASLSELNLPPDFEEAQKWHDIIMTSEAGASFLGYYTQEKDHLHHSLRSFVENTRGITKKDLLEAYDGAARLRPLWDSISREFDVVVTPSVIDEAPKTLQDTGSSCFCNLWTLLGVPALSVPGFSGENGLPIGLTLVASRYDDVRLLQVAKTVGSAFDQCGGWKSSSV